MLTDMLTQGTQMAQTSQILASIAAFALKNNVNTSYVSSMFYFCDAMRSCSMSCNISCVSPHGYFPEKQA